MLRAAALASAAFAVFFGVMYLRFSGDTVPPPEPTPSPITAPPAPISIAERCDSYVRVPKPPQCEPTGDFGGKRLPPTTPVPPPTVLGRVKVVPLEIGPEIDLPADIALIVPPNCGNCAGPTGGLSRVYRDANGQIRTDTLVTMESLGFAPVSYSDPTGPVLTGFAADEGGSTIAVGVCKHGPCFGGPGQPPPGDAETAILLSSDGGVSWSELQRLGGVAFVSGVLPNGRIVVGISNGKPEPPVYKVLPEGEDLTPPPGAGFAAPLSLASGDVIWPTEGGGMLRSDGSAWLGEWADPRHLQFAWKFVLDPGGERVLASATTVSVNGPGSGLVVVFRIDGTLERVYSVPGFFSPIAWLGDGRVLGHADTCAGSVGPGYGSCSGYRPALIDLDARFIHHFRPVIDPPVNFFNIFAVQRGPFARVVNTDETCVNIRSAPNTGAEIVDCAAEGVLLRTDGSTGGDGTNVFLHVYTPSGLEGWASTEYLEY